MGSELVRGFKRTTLQVIEWLEVGTGGGAG